MAARVPPGLRPGGRFDAWRPGPPALVLCDVDGTLLTGAHLPSLPVAESVGAATAAGLRVGVATGREWQGVRRLVDALALPGPHVLHNGAEVRLGAEVLERWPLPRDLAASLLATCLARGWYAELYRGDGFVVTDVRGPARQHWDILDAEPEGTTADLDLDRDVVIKATVIVFDPADLDPTLALLRGLGANASAGFAPATPALRYVNVTRADVDKGRAVVSAAKAAGVAPDTVAVLGDGYNDLALFEPAGTAIAMGQAPDEVRAAAHLVAPSVFDDGAATALHALAGNPSRPVR